MRKQYTEAFKLQVVRDIERGRVTASEFGRKYGVNGTLTIPRWLKRYGQDQTKLGEDHKRRGNPTEDPKPLPNTALKSKNCSGRGPASAKSPPGSRLAAVPSDGSWSLLRGQLLSVQYLTNGGVTPYGVSSA